MAPRAATTAPRSPADVQALTNRLCDTDLDAICVAATLALRGLLSSLPAPRRLRSR